MRPIKTSPASVGGGGGVLDCGVLRKRFHRANFVA